MIQITRITTPQGIDQLAPEWEALWRRAPQATPFQSPAWLLSWWCRFGSGKPLVLAARCGGELIAVLPLYFYEEAGIRKLLPIGIGLSDYVDALINISAPDVADRLLTAVAETDEWDECTLPELPPGAALRAAIGPPDLVETIAAASPCPVLELPWDAATLDSVVPRKTLRDMRQARARAAAAGGAAIESVGAGNLDEAMSDLFRLHESRWRSRGESGVCADAVVRAFHLAASRALFASGTLRLFRLWIGGTVRAVYYGFFHRRVAYAYLGGFDPGQPRLSLGAQIIGHAIEQAVAEGATAFHFLRGGESYKYTWGAVDRLNATRTFRPCRS